MDSNEERTPCKIDFNAPIDYDALKMAADAYGPIVCTREGVPYEILLTPTPCRCEDEVCSAELLMVSRTNGLFEVQWVISREFFTLFESLDTFISVVICGDLHDSRGERMIAEGHISRVFQQSYLRVPPLSCVCAGCLKKMGTGEPANVALLAQMAQLLRSRNEILHDASLWDEENTRLENSTCSEVPGEEDSNGLADLIEEAFELGYSLGRNFSEYAVKNEIEPLALIGQEVEVRKKKMAKAAGEKSSSLRLDRINHLMAVVEKLAKKNAVFRRLPIQMICQLSVEDAVAEKPSLWSQGRGQADEYMGNIRRGECGTELQARYNAVFTKA